MELARLSWKGGGGQTPGPSDLEVQFYLCYGAHPFFCLCHWICTAYHNIITGDVHNIDYLVTMASVNGGIYKALGKMSVFELCIGSREIRQA